jgi:membrane protein DedA with SNARE-associated domain/diacylglycerol kinase family enzyme
MTPVPAQLPISALTPVTAGLALALAVATAAVAAGLVPTPDLSGALEDASRSLGGWAYPAVSGLAFLETGAFVGLAVPGETAVVVGGVVASNGEVELVPLIALVALAAAAGDLVSFLIGRRYGPALLERHGERMRLDVARVRRVEAFYARHGGSAVLLGRFVGIVRAVSPFVAGTSGFPVRRFVPWSLLGALLWATAFTLVGYGFSESFAESGDTAARVAVGAALVLALAYAAFTALRARSGRLGAGRAAAAHEPQGDQAAEGAHSDPEQGARDHVEREVDAQVDARDGDGERDGERERPQARTEDRDGGGRGERRGAVSRRERGVVRERHQRGESRLADRRPGSPERFLESVRRERRGSDGGGRGPEGDGQAAAPDIGAETERAQERPLHPRRGHQDEHGGQPWMLERRSSVDESTVEFEQRRHRSGTTESSRAARLLVAVNGRASGIEDPERMADDLAAVLEESGAEVESVITESESELWEVLRFGATNGWRVVLVGGDGTLHAAANAPVKRLPELALVPAGRANNIARALGIPTSRRAALAVAAGESTRPLDALRVATPDRFIYALEAVSAGFQAEARSGYDADNSADLKQGVKALIRAIRHYRPYDAKLRIGGRQVHSPGAAQLFFSNLPFFGFGFEVAPGADPANGRFDAILLEARGRARLLRLLAAARKGRHIGRRGVTREPATRVELTEALPVVADAVPLGTTTATVTVEPARLRVAA